MPELTSLSLAHQAGGDAGTWWQLGAVVAISGLGAAYGRGVQELWSRGGRVVSVPRAVAFAGGIGALLLAQLPPLHDIAEESLAGHMVQHMVLVIVAGPLLALGGAGLPLLMALPRGARRVLARLRAAPASRWLRQPVRWALVVGAVHTVALWFWHLPAPYVAALDNPLVHTVEHVSFVAVGWLLWAAVLSPGRHRLNGAAAFLLLFAAGMAAAALGAVLTFAPAPLYPDHALAAANPLADQQLAGLVMWVPMDMVVLGLAVSVFLRWLTGLEDRTPGDREPRPVPVEEVTPR